MQMQSSLRSCFAWIICFCLATSSVIAVASEGRATLPYSKLQLILAKKAALKQRGLIALTTISSRNPVIRSADVSMSIESKAVGSIPVSLGSGGELSTLPDREALRKEDPPVVFNQPKGSLRITIALGLPLPTAESFPYRQLAEGLAEGNRAVKEQAGMFSFLAPHLDGMVFRFRRDRGGADSAFPTLTVTTTDGQRKVLTADAKQQLVLIIDPTLARKNAQVTLSEPPESIFLRLPSGETSW